MSQYFWEVCSCTFSICSLWTVTSLERFSRSTEWKWFPLSSPVGKRGVLKRPWSEAERAAVEEHLTQNITELRVPAKADCERCLQQCPLLVSNHRDWRAIKFYCHNRIQLLKKNQRRESEPQPLTVCWDGDLCGWRQGDVRCDAADGGRFSNGTLLPAKCTTFEKMVLNFSPVFFVVLGLFFTWLLNWRLMTFLFWAVRKLN